MKPDLNHISVISFLLSNTCTKLKSLTKHCCWGIYDNVSLYCDEANVSLLEKKNLTVPQPFWMEVYVQYFCVILGHASSVILSFIKYGGPHFFSWCFERSLIWKGLNNRIKQWMWLSHLELTLDVKSPLFVDDQHKMTAYWIIIENFPRGLHHQIPSPWVILKSINHSSKSFILDRKKKQLIFSFTFGSTGP